MNSQRTLPNHKTRPILAFLLALAIAIPLSLIQAQSNDVVQRELARRQAKKQEAELALSEGRAAYQEKDYETAVEKFKLGIDAAPASPETAELRAVLVDEFSLASLRLAQQRLDEGRMDEAKEILGDILVDTVDPNFEPAQDLLRELETPGRFNAMRTPEHLADVEKVNKLLVEALGLYELGRYDEADLKYEEILNIDAYNITAREGQQKIRQAKKNYYESAYATQRAQLLMDVDKAWEPPVRRFDYSQQDQPLDDLNRQGTAFLSQKLRNIIIPRIEFRNASIEEAIDFLRQKSAELDTFTPDPTNRGVNIVLRLDEGGSASGATPGEEGIEGIEDIVAAPIGASKISLNLSNVPLLTALRYVTELANLQYKIEPFAVVVAPVSKVADSLYTKTYRVPPNFIPFKADEQEAVESDPFATDDEGGTGGRATVRKRLSAKEYLEEQGVNFPPGATANFIPATSTLLVRNTQANIDLIELIVTNSFESVQKQIHITSKFLEVAQDDLKELGFDWLIGPFDIASSRRVFGSGGTVGNQLDGGLNVGDYPFVPPGPGQVPVGGNPLTAGNRSGSNAISGNAIDSLLSFSDPVSALAPGIFSLAGVFTDPQFQVVIRALNQKKGVDLLSAPSVTTRSGEKARIEIIRELIYPIEFEPPEIPQEFGAASASATTGGDGAILSVAEVTSFPVTPTTPTSFETRNTGVTLEVEPIISEDGYTIDLNLAPEVVEFQGFINYGSPIQTGAINALGQPTTVVLTENKIEMPVFSTRKVQTAVTIWDGQTVAIGGLIREDVQKVEDKVPFLGDIPFLGRLFRTEIDQHLKRNLVIFVNARMIDPAGQPIRDFSQGGNLGNLDEVPALEQEALPEQDEFLLE